MKLAQRCVLGALGLAPLASGMALTPPIGSGLWQAQAATVTATPGGLKPDATGLVNMGGPVPASMAAPNPLTLAAAEVLTTWGLLQPNPPTPGQPFDPREIDRINKMIVNAQGKGLRVKLRIWAGNNVPHLPHSPYTPSTPVWAMGLDGPPFYMNDYACAGGPRPGCSQPDGGSLTYEFPRWWTANFKTAFNTMETELGAVYDGNPTIAAVSSPRCMTIWDEPMVRQYDPWSLTNLLSAGYHSSPPDSTGDLRCQQDQLIALKNAWPHTVISFAVNPYYDITPPPPGKTDPQITRNDTETQAVIGFCRLQLGNQCLLENEELGRATSNPARPVLGTKACGRDPSRCFDAGFYNFLVGQGSPLGFMVEVPGNVDPTWPLRGILAQGVGWHSNSIEVGGPWFNLNRYPGDTPPFFRPFAFSLQTNPWGSSATLPTSTTLTAPTGAITAGEPLPVTVTTVIQATHTPDSAGTVQLLDESVTPPAPMGAPVPAGAGGITDISVILPAGRHVIASSFTPSTSSLRWSLSSVVDPDVAKGRPTVRVSTSNATPAVGAAVTLTVTVTLPGGGLKPTGQVTLVDINTHKTLATLTLSDGKAVLVTRFATKGTHVVTVAYGGDSNAFVGWAMIRETVG